MPKSSLHFFKYFSPQRHGDTEKNYKNSVSPCLCGEKYLKKCQLLLGINEGCLKLDLFYFIFKPLGKDSPKIIN